jgi:hypothetical protein
MVPSVVNILKKFSKIGRVESSLETNIESPAGGATRTGEKLTGQGLE